MSDDGALPRSDLYLSSTSRAQDMGLLAVVDISDATTSIEAEYRLVGGQMVSYLVYAYGVTGVPDRDTADADLGTHSSVAADPRLLESLIARGYRQVKSNYLERNLLEEELAPSDDPADPHHPAIDVLVPSATSKLHPGHVAGDMVVDAIPGLLLALNSEALNLDVAARLTTGREIHTSLSVPTPKAALCLKLLSYGSRYAPKDLVDIWRLLAVCHCAGVSAQDWKSSGSQGDALKVMDGLLNINNPQLIDVIPDQLTRAKIVAMRRTVAP